MIKPRVIGGIIFAPCKVETLPDRASGRNAATARAAAFRLMAVVMFNRSRSATMSGNAGKGAALAQNGLRLDAIARDLDRRGEIS